jgi:hypothetical protein
MNNLKSEIKDFNEKFNIESVHKPLSVQELGFLAGNIFTDILTSRIPFPPFKNKFVIFSIFLKIWKYRHRLKATILK